jgi:hypothetical protein
VVYKTTGNSTVFDTLPYGVTQITGDEVSFDLSFFAGRAVFVGRFEGETRLVGDITITIRDRGTVVDIEDGPTILLPLEE